MATQKQEFSAEDAAPAVLYAKTDANSKFATPLTQAMFNPKFSIPSYDYISLSPAAQPTSIVFKDGGASGTTVATLAIVYSSGAVSTVTRS